jgi:hypothetical protein
LNSFIARHQAEANSKSVALAASEEERAWVWTGKDLEPKLSVPLLYH